MTTPDKPGPIDYARQRQQQTTGRIPLHQHTAVSLGELYNRLDRAETAADQVRALHPQDGDYCGTCTTGFNRLRVAWPCPTIQAIGPTATEAAHQEWKGRRP